MHALRLERDNQRVWKASPFRAIIIRLFRDILFVNLHAFSPNNATHRSLIERRDARKQTHYPGAPYACCAPWTWTRRTPQGHMEISRDLLSFSRHSIRATRLALAQAHCTRSRCSDSGEFENSCPRRRLLILGRVVSPAVLHAERSRRLSANNKASDRCEQINRVISYFNKRARCSIIYN